MLTVLPAPWPTLSAARFGADLSLGFTHGLTHLKANELTNGDLVTELLGQTSDVLLDRNLGVLLHESLVEQTVRGW